MVHVEPQRTIWFSIIQIQIFMNFNKILGCYIFNQSCFFINNEFTSDIDGDKFYPLWMQQILQFNFDESMIKWIILANLSFLVIIFKFNFFFIIVTFLNFVFEKVGITYIFLFNFDYFDVFYIWSLIFFLDRQVAWCFLIFWIFQCSCCFLE